MIYIRENVMDILLFVLWLGLALTLTTARAEEVQGGGSKIESYSINLAFTTHLDASLPEQDVFIEREAGSSDVYRPTTGDNDMSAQLYKTAEPAPHNPFDERAVGPHPKGEAFGMTLGEWLKHQGIGTYTCTNGEGTLDTRFSNLIPNGVYTMWHAFTAIPATKPFSGFLDLPLGARDGSTSVFVANENGDASFSHTFKPCLQMSDEWTTSLLAVNYHSDGKTHAGSPGDFGYNAHVPLFLMLPPRDGISRVTD
jgi:hypothetical protein